MQIPYPVSTVERPSRETRRAAEDTLLDRTVFTVSPKVYRQFLARLDAPPKPNKRLLKSMQTRAPWE
jgi:uncharacterized protein (DUF1778 family)